jgi:hypothetical protein
MSVGFKGRLLELSQTLVTFSAGGSATTAVTFVTPFVEAPAVFVVTNGADEIAGATWTATGISKTGFTISISNSQFASQDRYVTWFAHEKD